MLGPEIRVSPSFFFSHWTWHQRDAYDHVRDIYEEEKREGNIHLENRKKELKTLLVKRAMAFIEKMQRFEKEAQGLDSLNRKKFIKEEDFAAFMDAKSQLDQEVMSIVEDSEEHGPEYKKQVFQDAHKFLILERQIASEKEKELREKQRQEKEAAAKIKKDALEEELRQRAQRELIEEAERDSKQKKKN